MWPPVNVLSGWNIMTLQARFLLLKQGSKVYFLSWKFQGTDYVLHVEVNPFYKVLRKEDDLLSEKA